MNGVDKGMKFCEANIGDKVKIINGLASGCGCAVGKVGFIISKEQFEMLSTYERKQGWNSMYHNSKEIGYMLNDKIVYLIVNLSQVYFLDLLLISFFS